MSPYTQTAPQFQIGQKKAGYGHPTFLIAEVGINHNGDLELAKKIIKLAHDAGFDAVKLQKKNPDLSVPEHQKSVTRETPWGVMTYLEYKKKIEFWEQEFDALDVYCRQLGIMWFASPWDEESVDFLEKYRVPCHKVPSALLTHTAFLEKLAKTGKPIILSTGMSTLEQIDQAVSILRGSPLALLHCTSTYPCALEELNLAAINTLRERYPEHVIGYSGHEPGLLPSVMAVGAHDAHIIERHVTFSRTAWGTDQAASLEKAGMETLVRDIRNVPIMRGDGVKRVYDSELPVMKKLRKY